MREPPLPKSSGSARLAGRLEEAASSPSSHPALTHLHPTAGTTTPRASIGSQPDRRSRGARRRRAASRGIERVHDRELPGADRGAHRRMRLDGDTIGQPTSWEAARLAAGCSIGRSRWWIRARAPAGSPRPPRPRDGLLHLRQRRRRSTLRTIGARDRAHGDRRLGRPSRKRHGGVVRATTRSSSSRCTSGPSTRARRAGDERRNDSTSRSRPDPVTGLAAAFAELVEPPVASFEPDCCSSRRASTPTATTRSPHGVSADGFRDLARALTSSLPARPRARGRLQPRDAARASSRRRSGVSMPPDAELRGDRRSARSTHRTGPPACTRISSGRRGAGSCSATAPAAVWPRGISSPRRRRRSDRG